MAFSSAPLLYFSCCRPLCDICRAVSLLCLLCGRTFLNEMYFDLRNRRVGSSWRRDPIYLGQSRGSRSREETVPIVSEAVRLGKLVPTTRRKNRPEPQSSRCDFELCYIKAGGDLGFYKGGCPIPLKGAPPPNYSDPCYRNQTIFLALEKIVGARRSYKIELCQITY